MGGDLQRAADRALVAADADREFELRRVDESVRIYGRLGQRDDTGGGGEHEFEQWKMGGASDKYSGDGLV